MVTKESDSVYPFHEKNVEKDSDTMNKAENSSAPFTNEKVNKEEDETGYLDFQLKNVPNESTHITSNVDLPSFLTRLKKTIDCPICTETLQRPFTTPCGHTYCYECLKSWLKASKSCPTCRQKVHTQPSPAYLVYDLMGIIASVDPSLSLLKTRDDPSKRREEVLFDGMFKEAESLYPTGIVQDAEDGVLRCARCQWELENPYHCDHCGFQISDEADSEPEWFWDNEDIGSGGSEEEAQRRVNLSRRPPITAVPEDWIGFGEEPESDFSGAGDYDLDDEFIDNRNASQLSPYDGNEDDFVVPDEDGDEPNSASQVELVGSDDHEVTGSVDEEIDSEELENRKNEELARELDELHDESDDYQRYGYPEEEDRPIKRIRHPRSRSTSMLLDDEEEDAGDEDMPQFGPRLNSALERNENTFDVDEDDHNSFSSHAPSAAASRRPLRRTGTIQVESEDEE
ncbi:ubiquitin-protein ligase E3 Dbl5 [Schizosaccharomyces osmophilus]|uniref:Ubiquitin-protein ligase E3 Dbl5 n=1 Tax=Schizosaccharomyces osmophilus TaxID=2545709 RepID=A0AAE9WH72_9SCHI|nr:ubiquitin-protein ligase E3 Dbl5 [Schizosaccharomyces osmophilus]WBW74967.1 ubiquitin-protein ligase E3 Dbl5 [Schizosaccharomyces osmophilus]